MLSNNLVKSLLFASLLTPTLYGCGGGESGGDDSGQNSGEPQVEQRATLSAIASTGGAISPEQVTVEKGDSVTFTVTADEGFELSRIAGCDGQLTGNLYHVTAAKESCRVEAQFHLKRYTVSSTVTGNGEVMPPELNLAHGEQSTVSLNPHEGFSLHSATGCGGTLAGNSYTIAAMNENCVINAVFTPTVYTVTASASNGGAISPSIQTVNYAGSATFTLTPETGYQIDAVTGCNGSLNGNTYTTGAISAACSVNASFKPLTFAVTASSNAGGAISPSTQTVNYAGSATFTLTPETGYQIDAVTGCNGSLNGNTYTTSAISAACSVNASFKPLLVTITASASSGGVISPATQTVDYGQSANFTLTADDGYQVDTVSGCGGTLQANTFTIGSATSNCAVVAQFVAQPLIGYFRDAPVLGLDYVSCTADGSRCIQGRTNVDGEFNYYHGDIVTFKVQNLIIGQSLGQSLVTPEHLYSEEAQQVRLAQFLMSVDSDGDLTNGISIDPKLDLKIPNQEQLQLAGLNDSEIEQLINETGHLMVTTEQAKSHLLESRLLNKLYESNNIYARQLIDEEFSPWLFGDKAVASASYNTALLKASPKHRLRLAIWQNAVSKKALMRADISQTITDIEKQRELALHVIDNVNTWMSFMEHVSGIDQIEGTLKSIKVHGQTLVYTIQTLDGVSEIVVPFFPSEEYKLTLSDEQREALELAQAIMGVNTSTLTTGTVDAGFIGADLLIDTMDEGTAKEAMQNMVDIAVVIKTDYMEKYAGKIDLKQLPSHLRSLDARQFAADYVQKSAKIVTDLTSAFRAYQTTTHAEYHQFAYAYLDAVYRYGANAELMMKHANMPLDLEEAAKKYIPVGNVDILFRLFTKRQVAIATVLEYDKEVNAIYQQFTKLVGGLASDVSYISFISNYQDESSRTRDLDRLCLEGYYPIQIVSQFKELSLEDLSILRWVKDDGMVGDLALADRVQISFNKEGWYSPSAYVKIREQIEQIYAPWVVVIDCLDEQSKANIRVNRVGDGFVEYQAINLANNQYVDWHYQDSQGNRNEQASRYDQSTYTLWSHDIDLSKRLMLDVKTRQLSLQTGSVQKISDENYQLQMVIDEITGISLRQITDVQWTVNDITAGSSTSYTGTSFSHTFSINNSYQVQLTITLTDGSMMDLAVDFDPKTVLGGSAVATGKLNDTGIDWCADGSQNNLDCPVQGYEGQDGEHGRDALARKGQLQKIGGGAAGFDFTKLDNSGNPLSASASEWSCVRDNHTGLIWEVKQAAYSGGLRDAIHTYSWYNPDNSTNGGDAGTQNGGYCQGSACDTYAFVNAVNSHGLCGASDWRLPSVNELLSIVHNGRVYPAIDQSYFPYNPQNGGYWSSSPFANYSSLAWDVNFDYVNGNYVHPSYKYNRSHVRLVRAGQ
ncbi:Lcl domain-containing protein [Vibrio vulnificus]|uniref:DUF1566 domain-containing protein n=1 Tax=Vibrio vulnificus TaxID=672 RepID=UPI00376CAC7A